MSSNAVSTNVSALKRRREDTAGGSIPTATFYSDGTLPSTMFASGNASAAPKVVSTDQYGTVWQGIYNDLVAGKHAIPSPHMVSNFAEIHLKSLNDYKGAQSSLQRATATSNGFALSSSGGTPSLPNDLEETKSGHCLDLAQANGVEERRGNDAQLSALCLFFKLPQKPNDNTDEPVPQFIRMVQVFGTFVSLNFGRLGPKLGFYPPS
ncbi:hypothetical protein B0H14DRAFT_3455667 [Mycena olivaceomarginata]|nr:hypothetical protein B0H14DRAFT_3455667 [Mycena olivaceomarginata]